MAVATAIAVFAAVGATAAAYSAYSTDKYYSSVGAQDAEKQRQFKDFWDDQLETIDPAIKSAEEFGEDLKGLEDSLYAPEEAELQLATGQTLEKLYEEGNAQKVKSDFADFGKVDSMMNEASQDVLEKSELESYKSINKLRRKKLEIDLDTAEDIATLEDKRTELEEKLTSLTID
jgi:hypothetical protein